MLFLPAWHNNTLTAALQYSILCYLISLQKCAAIINTKGNSMVFLRKRCTYETSIQEKIKKYDFMHDFLSHLLVDFDSNTLYTFAKYLIRIRIDLSKDTMATGHEIAMGLRAAYRVMHRQTDACLAKRGVTANQFVLLALLAEEDGVTQRELVRRSCSDPNTVSAMLVLLESRGLLSRRRHPNDGRARNVTLTHKGRRMYKRLWRESERLRQQLLELFQPKQADALVGLLKRISKAMI